MCSSDLRSMAPSSDAGVPSSAITRMALQSNPPDLLRGVVALTTRVLKESRVLISFEVTFVLYLYAGLFKADARLGWIPFDLTAAFFAVNVMSGIFILARRRWFVS